MPASHVRRALGSVLVAGLAALAGCGAGDNESARAPSATAVRIKGYAYRPSTITVRAGGTVRFTNADATKHTATARDPAAQHAFDTSGLIRGRSRTVTFAKAGRYAYFCVYHPFMKGTVVVRG